MESILKYIAGGIVIKGLYDFFTIETKSPQRRIFISHSWERGSEDYLSLKKKLKEHNVKIYDHSIPSHKAFDEDKREELEKIFRNQMIYCSKILVIANSGIDKNSFVMTEIKIAKELKKEIIAIKPYGQYSMPTFIRNHATKIISNNINSIIKALQHGHE
ncbi:TIR domain-containing protein [Aquimarina litoralis]|uniref:TIR domain-containing protein n=1 Tax=Aquimarina litoralis TaxID=584605 RepID=UPI001C565A67|nr:TIR domain-containing protein [Aquimarina litoralis]